MSSKVKEGGCKLRTCVQSKLYKRLFSTFPFDLELYGATKVCLSPRSNANSAISSFENSGPLSVTILRGIECMEM